MGNTVARSHIRDADRGVARATRVNTRHNSSNVPAPPPAFVSPSATATSSPSEDEILAITGPSLPDNRHSFPSGLDPLDSPPTKRRARNVSAEAAFAKPLPKSLPDLEEPPPGASPAEIHAARTETTRADKPPHARKVVSFNENVHVVTYPYEGSHASFAELPAITRYPEPKNARRRSRSVFRLLSRTPSDHQCDDYETCCSLRIASDTQSADDDNGTFDDRPVSFESSKNPYDDALIVSYERPYSDAIPDDFDYVHREIEDDEQDDDTFSLSDAHPSCDAIEEPEAIGDQLLSKDESRDSPAFDIAPLWQRLKRVDELDAVAKNTFLRESGRCKHARAAKPPRPPRRDTSGISHSRATRAKARRNQEVKDDDITDETTNPRHSTSPSTSVHHKEASLERVKGTVPVNPGEDLIQPANPSVAQRSSPTKSIATSDTTPNSSPPKSAGRERTTSDQIRRGTTKDLDPAQERRIPAPSRSRTTSAGSIQKHMASFTTESAASTDREFMDAPSSLKNDNRDDDDAFITNPMVATSSAITVEPKSDRNLSQRKEQDLQIPFKNRVRSEPHRNNCEEQPLATSLRTSRSARVLTESKATEDEFLSTGIRPRATVRPKESPILPEVGREGENTSHSWARLNDLTRSHHKPTQLSSKRSFAAPLRPSLEARAPIEFPEVDNDAETASTDRESDRASTLDLDLDPLSLPVNEDYGVTPWSPVQGYAPVAGVYYGNSSPSAVDPGSPTPRLELSGPADVAEYPEYEMLNGTVNDDSVFGSEPNTPILGTNSNWAEPFDEVFFGLGGDIDAGALSIRNGKCDRKEKQSVPEVLLHDWSGSTPVEPNVEMVDSAPNSKSSTSRLFTEDVKSKAVDRESGNTAVMLSKRMNVDLPPLFKRPAFMSDGEAKRAKKGTGATSNSGTRKVGSDRGAASLRRSRSDRLAGSGSEVDTSSKLRGHGRSRRAEASRKFSLSNTEAWVSSDYEFKETDSRAKSDAHEPDARSFFPALPAGFPQDPKLHDFQLSVERKSVSEMGYRKGGRTGRGASFVDRELPGDDGLSDRIDTWRDGIQEQGQKRLALAQKRRQTSDVDDAVASGAEGTLRGMVGRLVSGMNMAKRLVTPN